MKKLVISLLLVVLVIPSLALAREGKGTRRLAQREGAHRWDGAKLVPVAGKILSMSANTVTVAKPVKSKDAKAKFKHVKVRTSGKPELRGLLAKGLGRKAELLCRKAEKGGLVLVRIKSIEGVKVPSWKPKDRGIWKGVHGKGQERGSGQRETMKGRFRAMAKRLRENPKLREELRNLAKKDFEAFRQRIRRIHTELSKSIKGDKPAATARRGPGPRRRPSSPEIAKLEGRSQQLAKRYRQAKGGEKEELGDKLRGTLSEICKLKVRALGKQIERLEKQVDRLREGLERRERNREAMIQKRFDRLTGEEEELPW